MRQGIIAVATAVAAMSGFPFRVWSIGGFGG